MALMSTLGRLAPRGPRLVVTATVVLWCAGAVLLWKLIADEVDRWGVGHEWDRLSVSAGWYLPVVLALPLGGVAGWAMLAAREKLTASLLATTCAVGGAVLVASFLVTFRLSGDATAVEWSVIRFAWQFYALAAALDAVGFAVGAWWVTQRFRASSARRSQAG